MNVPPPDEGISLGELSRRLTDVFTRFEGLARRLEEGQFVRTELYLVYKEQVNAALSGVQQKTRELENHKASKTAFSGLESKVKEIDNDKVDKTEFASLVSRVTKLEDDKTWLVRLVIGFIILAVLGVYFASGGAK